jgi:hypothetical protein
VAWLRLSDDYIDHPKFTHLSDGAFRLWHEAMAFCRKYQTDGLIPMATAKAFKSFSPKRATVLLTPWTEGANPLWRQVEGFGYKVHDYLQWNLSKEQEQADRRGAKARMRSARGAAVTNGEQVDDSDTRTNGDVLGMGMDRKGESSLDGKDQYANFNAFWSAYPKKKAKDDAQRAWDKRRPNDELLAVMLRALERQKHSPDWQKESGRYIPFPATWLNQARWTDEDAEVGSLVPHRAFECPHDPPCDGRFRCHQKTELDAMKAVV